MSEDAFEDKQERQPWQAPEPMIVVPGLQARIVQRLHEIGEFNRRLARLVELTRHLGVEVVTKSNAKPKLSDADWKRISVTEYAPLYRAFLDAARGDLAPTR